MNPLKKAASLLKGKSVKQVQIDSDSDSDVDSKSSTPMKANVSTPSKRNIFGMKSPGAGRSIQSPETKSNQSNIDTQLQQLQAASRGASVNSPQSLPKQQSDSRINLASAAPKSPSDRSIGQSSIASRSINSSATPAPPPPPPHGCSIFNNLCK
jgi:hypothetical protein